MLSSFENWRPGKSRDFVPFQPGPMLKVTEARTGWLLLFFFDVAVVVFMGVGGGLGSTIELAGVEVWLLAVLWCIGLVLGESVG